MPEDAQRITQRGCGHEEDRKATADASAAMAPAIAEMQVQGAVAFCQNVDFKP